jgi:hypothetical protein
MPISTVNKRNAGALSSAYEACAGIGKTSAAASSNGIPTSQVTKTLISGRPQWALDILLILVLL